MHLTLEMERLLKDKKLLIFDFDGTIADTSALHAAAFAHVFTPLGVTVDYKSVAGMKSADVVVRYMNAYGITVGSEQIQKLVVAKQTLVRQMIAEQLRPLPGVDCFLKWAKRHYHLSIATSGSRETIKLALEKLGYLTVFDTVVCSEDVEHAKPNSQVFEKVLTLTHHKPDQALVFEDSESGLDAARSAGIECVRIEFNSWLRFFKDDV